MFVATFNEFDNIQSNLNSKIYWCIDGFPNSMCICVNAILNVKKG